MIDLQKISGLPILFDEENNNLEFQGDFGEIKKSERSLEELKPYLSPYGRCPEGTKNSNVKSGPSPVYYVWRYVNLKKDALKLKEAHVRYDITLIPPGKIDSEFSKTAGHFHKNKIGTNLPHPEIYEVLIGRAYFLIQSPEKDTKNIKTVRLIEAGPGEKVLVSPQFPGHTTINAFNKPLIMANWISDQAVYDYDSYKNNHGASYYLLDSDNRVDPVRSKSQKATANAQAHWTSNGVDIVKNPNYNSVPEIQKIGTKEYPEFGLTKNQPIYNLVNNIEKLRFLNYPEEFEFKL